MVPRKSLFLVLSLLLPCPLFADAVYVTNTFDSGPGSLRQAMLDANSGACPHICRIILNFQRPPIDSEIPLPRIDLKSPLPELAVRAIRISPTDSGFEYFGRAALEINGAEAGPDADGLRIRGSFDTYIAGMRFTNFSRNGVDIRDSMGTRVISVDALRNGGNGLMLVDTVNTRIGGATLSGNGGNGIYIAGSREADMTGLQLGVIEDDKPLGNAGNGMHLHAVQNIYTSFMTVAHNRQTGVLVTGNSTVTDFEYSRFFSNGLLAIDHGGDGPTEEGTPVLDSVGFNRGWVRAHGHVRTKPNSEVRIQIFYVDEPDPSGFGEGTDYLWPGNGPFVPIKTDANGHAVFTYTFQSYDTYKPLRGKYLTAIASVVEDSRGFAHTSEFSRAMVVTDDDVSFVVTHTGDSGPGSLRRAIEDSNESGCEPTYPCEIAFRIATPPNEQGVHVIQPVTQLPPMTRSAVTMVGYSQTTFGGDTNPAGPEIEVNGALCRGCNGLSFHAGDFHRAAPVAVRNIIVNGFDGDGFVATTEGSGGLGAAVLGCYVGTDSTGTRAVPNRGAGIRVKGGYVNIGGYHQVINGVLVFGQNVISGNGGDGVRVDGGSARLDVNYIGTDPSGLYPVPNGGHGLMVNQSAAGAFGNIIAFNVGSGIVSTGGAVSLRNSIHSNGGMGLDFGDDGVTENGPEAQQNAPEITSAVATAEKTTIFYRLDAPQPTGEFQTYLVDFFAGSFADASGRGEGRLWIGSKILHRTGEEAKVEVDKNLAGKYIAATAMRYDVLMNNPSGGTSEYSPAVQAVSGGCPDTLPSALAQDGMHFRWTPAVGAGAYRVWVMKPGQMPRFVYEGVEPEAMINLDRGTYEWWVEARFDPCYGTQSSHERVVVE